MLLLHGAKVYITARDSKKAQDAVKELSDATKHTPGLLVLDLSDLGSVKTAAEHFLRYRTFECHFEGRIENDGAQKRNRITYPVQQCVSLWCYRPWWYILSENIGE